MPSRLNKHKKVWQKKVGVRNEALDCEVYALHAARSLGTHSMSAGKWALYEQALLQAELFALAETEKQPENPVVETQHGYAAARPKRKRGNFATDFK